MLNLNHLTSRRISRIRFPPCFRFSDSRDEALVAAGPHGDARTQAESRARISAAAARRSGAAAKVRAAREEKRQSRGARGPRGSSCEADREYARRICRRDRVYLPAIFFPPALPLVFFFFFFFSTLYSPALLFFLFSPVLSPLHLS